MPPVRKVKPTSAPAAPAVPAERTAKRTVVSGQLEKKIQKQQLKADNKRGVVFIKHLPHGFFEEQLKNYFKQFGNVTRLRLCRSRRTGGSKGYAFVEFEYPEVAQVAAETMDNYLMFKKVVKAAYIPPDKQRFNYFKTGVRKVKNKAGKEIFTSHKMASIQRKAKQHNDWSDDNYQKRSKRTLEKIKKLNQKYAHLGIDFTQLAILPENIKKQAVPDETAPSSSSSKKLAVNKKTTQAETAKKAPKSTSTKKQSKQQLHLEDLLGNTINDDSDDEDYIAMSGSDDVSAEEEELGSDDESEASDDDGTSTDEETYGFTKDSDDDAALKKTKKPKLVKSGKASFGKPVKSSKIDRFEQLIKRKPHTGAIKKAKKPVVAKKIKSSVQISAAKEMAKTLRDKPIAKPKANPARVLKVTKKGKLRK